MRPVTAVSFANIRSLTDGSLEVQLLVYRQEVEESSGESTHPWEAPVLIERVLDMIFPSLTCCLLSVRKFVIH